MFLDLLLFIWLASMYTYKQTIHTTVDPQAMALAPDLRTGMAFSPSIQMQLSKDIAEGMLTVEMTRSGTLTNAYSDFLGKKRSGDVMWTSLSKRSTAKGSGNV